MHRPFEKPWQKKENLIMKKAYQQAAYSPTGGLFPSLRKAQALTREGFRYGLCVFYG